MRPDPGFPYNPKSTARLRSGMFWPIVLTDGAFAAGVVLGVPRAGDPHLPTSSRIFVAGLLDWFSGESPTPEDLGSAQLVTWGAAHVKSIDVTSAGAGVTGATLAELNGVEMVSHRGGGDVAVYVNGMFDRSATARDIQTLPGFGTWGLGFVQALAERYRDGAT